MSVSMQDVRQALNELGKLRFGEMRVEDAMHQIVQTTHAIFNVDGAGLMLADVDHHLLNAAVSDERMRHLEELQIRHQEGPCIAAFEDKELVRAEDLTREARWPSFSKHAVARGIRAVLASPIPYNQDAVGVVAVTSEDSHPWSAEAELALLAFTDLAGAHFMDCGSARLIATAGHWLPGSPRPVIRHPGPGVRRILELTGLDAQCEIEELAVGSIRTWPFVAAMEHPGAGR